MKFEKILLACFAILGGLIVAGVAFYLYQSTKTIPASQTKTIRITTPTPPLAAVPLTIDNPKNESVTDNKTVTVSGTTQPGTTLVISTDTSDQVISPTNMGAFTTTVTIGSDENYIHVLAIAPSGEETEKTLTVTYSAQSF